MKFVLNHEEKRTLSQLASAMGHDVSRIRKGLELIHAQGFFTFTIIDDHINIVEGGESVQEKVSSIRQELKGLLAETAAYRSYYRRMDSARFLEDISDNL